MRLIAMIFGLMLVAAPATAQGDPGKQEPAKGEPKEAPKETPKEAPKDASKDESKEDGKEQPKDSDTTRREMTPEGKKLFEDVKLVYAKYYAVVLEKTRANESYKATEVWDMAVKEARNAKYKDNKEWSDAIGAMKRKDKVFQKELAEFIALKAEEHNKELRKIREGDSEKK